MDEWKPKRVARRKPKNPRVQRSPNQSKCDSKLEVAFDKEWDKHYDVPVVPQLQFHPARKWRFDFSLPSAFIAIEIQGFGSGHTSYTGMQSDYEKHNAAVALGWSTIFLMSEDLKPAAIKKTCDEIYALWTIRMNNQQLILALKELNSNGRQHFGRRTIHTSRGAGSRSDYINEAIRRFDQGLD